MTIHRHFDFEVPGFGAFQSPPIAVPSYAQAVLDLGPVAYWRLGEQAGPTLADQIDAHPMSLSGGYSLGEGGAVQTDVDTSLRLTTGIASTVSPVIPTQASAAYSFVFWLRTPGTIANDMPFIGQYAAGQTGRMLVTLLTEGGLRYTAVGDASLVTQAQAGSDWRMFAYTRSVDGTARWLVDGQLDQEATSHDVALHSGGFSIGKLTSLTPDIFIDEVAVFSYELTQADARWLYAMATGGMTRPPSHGA